MCMVQTSWFYLCIATWCRSFSSRSVQERHCCSLHFNKTFHVDWLEFFLQCSLYFSMMHLIVLYIVAKFQLPNSNTLRDMNYCLWFLVQSGLQTESGAYEPTVPNSTGGLKKLNRHFFFSSGIIFSRRRTSSTKQYTECRLKRFSFASIASLLNLRIVLSMYEAKMSNCWTNLFDKAV